MAKVFVTVSGTVIPRVSLNEILDVNTSGGQDGYVLTQQADGTFALEQVVTSLSGLSDVNLTGGGPPEPRDFLMYDGSEWINENVSKSDVGLGNVDNTSDADKPVSTATQTALNAKADTSAVPTTLNDLSDVTITGTPTGNQALIYDGTAGVFKSLPNFTNRFEDEAENNKQSITPFAERVYTVKSDGDGIFIDPESDTPTAGKVIKRKIYQKAGFLESGAVIGDFTLIHTFADDTAYSATESTFEGFRDGDTYGTPPITLIQTWEEQTAAPAFTGLLNESYGSGAAAAYSVRRLNGNYTGAAIQVERSSDNTTQDIGFDSNGDLDESALSTFCSGTVCKVRTWYGQEASGGTGSGNDAVQTDHTKQPTIYTGGAIVKENGNPAIRFNGSNNTLDFTTTSSTTTCFIVQETIGTDDLLISSKTSNSRWHFFMQDGDTRTDTSQFRTTTGNFGYKNGTLVVTEGTTTRDQVHTAFADGTQNLSSWIGLDNAPADNYRLSGYFTGTSIPYAGDVQEVIMYNTDHTSNRTSIESNIGDYFTQNTPLLDTYTGAAAAYSLRKLRTAYSGSAIRVRRASDNTEQDIGFNIFGELDTVSLASFCSGTNGFVKTWYDQASTNDATQTNTSQQPKIYDSTTGVITNNNGNLAVKFTRTSSTSLSTPAFDMIDTGWFCVTVAERLSTTGDQKYIDSFGGLTDRTGIMFQHASAGLTTMQATSSGGGGATVTGSISSNVTYLWTSENTLSNLNLYINGSSAGTASITSQGDDANGFTIGARKGGTQAFSDTYSSEIIYYRTDQSSNRTNIESNINTFYSIY